jgi:bifunctional UDP-N-acetylglucosamine pyrophosphorylase/glucosamine-1-phosphate N-acetyltransferase
MTHIDTVAVILAAGQGKRLKSDLPKVLQEINGKTLIEFVIETVRKIGVAKVLVVIGHQGGLVQYRLKSRGLEFVWQREQLGTGHALLQSRPFLEGFKGKVLALCGDMPLVSAESLEKLIAAVDEGVPAAVLTGELEDPAEYGRVIRSRNDFLDKIVEVKDLNAKEKKVREISSGTFCFDARTLFSSLEQLTADNAQQEYYLSDLPKLLKENGKKTAVVTVSSADELRGVNSEEDLTLVKEIWANRKGYPK